MLLASEKFKYLSSARNLLSKGCIPEYQILNQLSPQEVEGSFILRSSLRNEASKIKLLSGKSLSIKGIDSWQKLQDAWIQVQKQNDLHEVILQEEILWDKHVTLIYEKDFFFAELTSPENHKEFLHWTPLASSQTSQLDLLKGVLGELLPLLRKEERWLLEAGIKNGKVYIFQLHPIGADILSRIFSSELAAQVVASRLRFSKSHGLWNLLKTEWSARSFRKQVHRELKPSQIFMNWEFLFHYFKLFCMLKGLRPDANAFAQFLSDSYREKWPASLMKRHLELAQYFRTEETFDPVKAVFNSQGPLFIGKGKFQATVGKGVLTCEEISLQDIYQKTPPFIILTKEVGMLGHPVLASVENGIGLVLGMESLPPEGARIYLDFDEKTLRVE